MVMRNIHGAHAVSALKDQAKRFETMSVHLAKSPSLAITQADEIAKWSTKLIDAIDKIKRDTKAAAIMCQQHLHSKIDEFKTQADSRKRRILDTQELGSSRTLRANFRLIFGPARETEYSSKSTKHLMSTITERINTIRGLCDEYPDGVIVLSIGYPTKTWTEPVSEIFEAISRLKQEKLEKWPEEILDIMNELRNERPMSAEFEILRAKISERQGNCRRRMQEPYQPVADVGQPVPATNNLDAPHPPGQANPMMINEQNLHDTARISSSSRSEPSMMNSGRQIQYMFSKSPANNIGVLGALLANAIRTSNQWKMEKAMNDHTTECLNMLIPKGRHEDVSITLWVGQKEGLQLLETFQLQPTWSELPSHPPPLSQSQRVQSVSLHV
ncbi:hypothetical protein BO71DRAFT_190269 [Aspergillus ellipticus CBS 707.79]|uniref:Uncharacterized protein n=1 Tax=Aspergillus ellipticus CBS 707.79 TaxID=1448320 RepID=A0A319DEZ9_9EURO|nr:hypothetical protein BO71DRAFT_190269 [Aspergillus ellipticus CBS 707.79]